MNTQTPTRQYKSLGRLLAVLTPLGLAACAGMIDRIDRMTDFPPEPESTAGQTTAAQTSEPPPREILVTQRKLVAETFNVPPGTANGTVTGYSDFGKTKHSHNLKYAYLLEGYSFGKVRREIALSTVDISAKIRACKTLLCGKSSGDAYLEFDELGNVYQGLRYTYNNGASTGGLSGIGCGDNWGRLEINAPERVVGQWTCRGSPKDSGADVRFDALLFKVYDQE